MSASAPPGLSTFTTWRSARSRSSQWNAELHTTRSTLAGCSDASSNLPTSHGERKRRQPLPRERRQVLAELHGVDPEPALEQRERGVARPAADLERVRGRGHEGGHGVEELGRRSPSRAGVELGHLVEAAAAFVGGSSGHRLRGRCPQSGVPATGSRGRGLAIHGADAAARILAHGAHEGFAAHSSRPGLARPRSPSSAS